MIGHQLSVIKYQWFIIHRYCNHHFYGHHKTTSMQQQHLLLLVLLGGSSYSPQTLRVVNSGFAPCRLGTRRVHATRESRWSQGMLTANIGGELMANVGYVGQ